MDREALNYGVQREHGTLAAPYPPVGGAMTSREERTWSALAHLSTYLNIFTGFLGPVAAFFIWIAYRDKSPTVAHHALRSALYQVAWLVAIVVGWTITGVLTAVLIGFLLVPVMILVTLAPFVQASYEAYMAYRGAGRRYYL
jgi:uncharacterized protein